MARVLSQGGLSFSWLSSGPHLYSAPGSPDTQAGKMLATWENSDKLIFYLTYFSEEKTLILIHVFYISLVFY